MNEERIPPQAIDIEEVFLGALLIESDHIQDVRGILPAEAMYKDAHRIIYSAILDLKEKADILTVTNYLRDHNKLEQVGGAKYISQLSARVASASHVKYHLSIIYDKWVSRECIKIGSDLVRDAYDADDILDTLHQVRTAMDDRILLYLGINSTGISIIDAAEKSIDDYYIREQGYREGKYSGIPSTFKLLNRMTGGFNKGQLIVLASRTGMGKTSMAISFMMTAAQFKFKCAFFSMEMLAERLMDKVICSLANIDHSDYKKGKLMEDQRLKAEECASIIEHWNVIFNDTMLADVEQIHATCRKIKDQQGIDIVFIDYLQLMRTKEKTGNREQEISTMSRKCKMMAVDLGVPVILLSQLNRSLESRADKRPMLSDLRESGAIEQDADIVLFIYRDSEYNNDAPYDKGELIVSKHREGARGTIIFRHNQSLTRFTDEEDGIDIDMFSPERKPF